MFSKKILIVAGLILVLAVNITILSFSGKQRFSSHGLGKIGLILVAPFQEAFTRSISSVKDVWKHYFFLD
jgi:rod shape-determining protein MreC